MQNLTPGTRIYNHGDMANPSHFGAVSAVKVSTFGTQYQITPDADADYGDKVYWINAHSFSPVFKGNGLTRLVTEDAYNEWREARLRQMQRNMRVLNA